MTRPLTPKEKRHSKRSTSLAAVKPPTAPVDKHLSVAKAVEAANVVLEHEGNGVKVTTRTVHTWVKNEWLASKPHPTRARGVVVLVAALVALANEQSRSPRRGRAGRPTTTTITDDEYAEITGLAYSSIQQMRCNANKAAREGDGKPWDQTLGGAQKLAEIRGKGARSSSGRAGEEWKRVKTMRETVLLHKEQGKLYWAIDVDICLRNIGRVVEQNQTSMVSHGLGTVAATLARHGIELLPEVKAELGVELQRVALHGRAAVTDAINALKPAAGKK